MRHSHTCNLPGTLCTTDVTDRNRTSTVRAKPTVEISGFAEKLTVENAIYIAKTEIECLDELSLDGSLPDGVSDSE